MRYLLSIFLALAPLWAMGATGDIIDIQINADGWTSSNVVSGLSTGGTYANGLGATAGLVVTNMVTGSEKYVLNVTSSGYTTAGAVTTWPRKVYGTKIVRIAGGNSLDEQGGSNLTNRFALSDWIFSGDTITRTIASGWVTQGSPNNATSGGSVANNSPCTVPLVIGNWSRPNYRKVSGSTMRLGFVAFHAYPRSGKPVACVKFIVSDQHSHTVTNTETAMRIDSSLAETIPTPEYYSDIALSSFTAGDLLTCDVEAFPWIGTSTSILDTSVVRGWEGTTYSWHPVTRTNVYDGNDTYCPFIAVVDASTGSDTTGRATNTTYDKALQPFLTIGQAVKFIQNSNNSFATPTHNDPGGGVVYLRANVISFPGSNPAINRGSAEVIIAPYPGDVVAITNVTSTGVPFGQQIHWTNIMFANTNNYAVGWQVEQVVVDNCTVASTSAVLNSGVTNCWFLNSHIISNPGFFVSTAGPQVNGFLWRNCFFDGYGGTVNAAMMMGCHRDATNGYGFTVASDQSGFTASRPEFCIIYNNLLRGYSGTANDNELGIGINFGTSNGCAVVQNVFEVCTNSGTPAITSFGIQDTLNYTNLLAFNNTVIIKSNWLYNDVGTASSAKIFCFLKNNYFTEWNIKSDIFGTPNANRIGNWSCVWGVGWTGNAFLEITNFTTTSGTFLNEFSGLNSIGENMSGGANGSQRTTNFVQWVTPKCWDGGSVNSWPGGGLYRTKSDSSLLNMNAPDVIIPFDIEGVARGDDPPGAYASARPKHGGSFFGQ
jgi:hypothetical protein